MAHILLAEDEDSVRQFVVIALQSSGHTVIAASDGGLAAEILDKEGASFDLLLSDIRMPVMDGIALALHTAARWPELPILLMTGFADQRERAEDLSQVIRDVLTKPFTLQQIRAAVHEAAEETLAA